MHGGGVVIIIAVTAAFVVLCASFCFLWLVRHSFSLSLLAQYVIKSTKNEQISKSFHKMNAPSRMHPKNYWHKSADKHKMKTALNSLRFSYGRVLFFSSSNVPQQIVQWSTKASSEMPSALSTDKMRNEITTERRRRTTTKKNIANHIKADKFSSSAHFHWCDVISHVFNVFVLLI